MDTKPLENFAKAARRELIVAVEGRVSTVLADGSVARSERAQTVQRLESAIAEHGRQYVVDQVAYTWFNRLIALRFMDARGYTDAGIVSPVTGQPHGQPEILADAKRGDVDAEVVTDERSHDAIVGLLDGTRRSTDPEGEAYALLLAEYCRHWHKAMPLMFEAEGAYTSLLVPAGLLAEGSVLSRARDVLTEEVCDDVEVIGWLYQFYISERKDEVFAGFKKNKKAGAAEIPAATQLFTPHWIVRYLVENSVGRLWMLNHPASRLVEQMDYYIAPVDPLEDGDFLKISGPEELTVIDPACGSGHMLTYAFDLLYAIYEEAGYAASDIPGLILTHNLHGTEIDPRAGALAAFALTMKARARQRTFFNKQIRPNICVISPVVLDPSDITRLVTADVDQDKQRTFWRLFEHADTFGALIRPDATQTKIAAGHVSELADDNDLFTASLSDQASQVVRQAEYLSRRYAVAVANPPYMGSKQMNGVLTQFMKDEYPTGKADLMAAFMVRAQELTDSSGTWGMINLPSWMSLKSFEELRKDLLRDQRIASVVHLGRGVFGSDFGSVAFVVDNSPSRSVRGVYRRLFEQHVDVRSVAIIEALFRNSDYNRFEVCQVDFAAIPGSPIVYWLSEKMREVFSSGTRLGVVADIKHGLSTGKNDAVVRLWWETSVGRFAPACASHTEAEKSGKTWFPYNSGGAFRKWYGNVEKALRYDKPGRDLMASFPGHRHDGRARYFQQGVTWSKVSSGDPAFRSQPAGQVFDVAGNGFFHETPADLDDLLAFCNSSTAQTMLAAISPTLNFEAGQIAKLPVTTARNADVRETVDQLVGAARLDWDGFETSWDFKVSPLVPLADRTVTSRL
ncbi:BREX-1 system adenine-specific DNA-methyltransferase PglX [Gordonia malaquae]|uniref:BREX-1 system adenine-specific DNA-methyltransferase PglX n=1 Tax=Gordonia malaquae TaxID=410332 RepID=UPI0030FE165C